MQQILDGLQFVFGHPLNHGRFWRTLGRLLWWKFNQRFLGWPTVVPLTNRINCLCYPHLSYSGLIVYTQWPDYYEWKFLQSYLKKGHIFVDIGAHSGDYSLLAADKITTGKIYAFEPEPTVLPYLRANVAFNSLDNTVTIIPKAVGHKKGRLTFTLDPHSETSHLSRPDESSRRQIKVPTTTLDIFAQENALDKIDVLKIDVEGAEGLVLAGAKNLLAEQRIDVVLFEYNDNDQHYRPENSAIALLSSFGYYLYRFASDGSLRPIDPTDNFAQTCNLLAFAPRAKSIALQLLA